MPPSTKRREFVRVPGLLLVAGIIGGASVTASAISARSVEQASTITVTVTNMRSTEGVVRACITARSKGFPKCDASDAGSINVVAPAAETVTFSFTNVTPGRYAIALLHDENNNGKADRALMMMPTEGFGFSRDAKVRMGPPKFDDAAFDVAGNPIVQTIRMRYML
ncbi:DUF2141 domain-containing protein [Allopontixanthobacter sp.]|uniref:DUF2141 domain-containing protein n=1 Tax=Allopontixanthobacter sp. TaxID=2906452 RepID=UPI002AB8CC81|nr:DUF2141 domain-containing protein [Allopontixanthobacter sp.]MDZ4308643.1 DUF2141 domain-containing protein [Allopontixanthobacter sp.]